MTVPFSDRNRCRVRFPQEYEIDPVKFSKPISSYELEKTTVLLDKVIYPAHHSTDPTPEYRLRQTQTSNIARLFTRLILFTHPESEVIHIAKDADERS